MQSFILLPFVVVAVASQMIMSNGNGNQMISSGGTQITRGRCYYQNGYISENGGTPKPATQAQKNQISRYQEQLRKYTQDTNKYWQEWSANFQRNLFNPNKPATPPAPTVPSAPCVCSPQFC